MENFCEQSDFLIQINALKLTFYWFWQSNNYKEEREKE